MKLPEETAENYRHVLDLTMRIARSQARQMHTKTGLELEELVSEALLAAGIALTKRDRVYGFLKFAKVSIHGHLCNYVRDSARVVKVPRAISILYMRRHRLQKQFPEISDSEVCMRLGCTIEQLLEVDTCCTLFHSSIDANKNYDVAAPLAQKSDQNAEIALSVINLGIATFAKQYRIPLEAVKDMTFSGIIDSFASRQEENEYAG